MIKNKLTVAALSLLLVGMATSCQKENKDIFSETKWQLIGNSLESINDSDCTLEFDNEGNVSIGGNLDIPYSVDNNVITLLYPQPSTTTVHHFILSDDEQTLKILNDFHPCSLTQDIWDTTYFKRVN